MSIAKVKIAPVERWCKAVRDGMVDYPEANGQANEVGMAVAIKTETMRHGSPDCAGREWELTEESLNALIQRTGADSECWTKPCFICEHMLEMD